MRVKLRELHGECEVWDGTPETLERIRVLVGDRFIGLHGTHVIILTPKGEHLWMRPGWSVIKYDGDDNLNVRSDDAHAQQVIPE
jgi:hypothetical protein